MIIQELNNLYLRLADDPDTEIAHRGWSTEKVTAEVVINSEGLVVNVVPYASGEGRESKKYLLMQVPEHAGRSGSRPAPYFLCDTPAYLLGLGDMTSSADTPQKKRERSKMLHEDVLGGVR